MALSAVTVLFSEEERPKAVGIWSAANFIALPIGPILGGWLLTHYWGGWGFLMNVPVALVGLPAAFALIPESRAPRRPGLDLLGVAVSAIGLLALTYGLIEAGQHGWGGVGALLPLIPESRAPRRPGLDLLGVAVSAIGLLALTYGLIEAGQHGWGEIGALLPMLVGVAMQVAFLRWERRLSRRPGGQPLVDLALFRSASFTWGVMLAAVAILAMIGVLFTMPQYFQGVLGTNAM